MRLNKTTYGALLCVLNGNAKSAHIAEHMPGADVRTLQRALSRLTETRLLIRTGASNNPTYEVNHAQLLLADIDTNYLEDQNRPETQFNHGFLRWLMSLSSSELKPGTSPLLGAFPISSDAKPMTPKELEYLTIELSWKSSALEGNTYSLIDTQLLLVDGIKAKNKTDFETQMIINHKNAIAFIVQNGEYFTDMIEFKTVEELHRIISFNLGIESGIRTRLVRITASNYVPSANPHQLKEIMTDVLAIINAAPDARTKSLLALALVPYTQCFEDGNKRLGRMLANAILIHGIGRGFSLRKVEAKELALAYLAFYEFNSIKDLAAILNAELQQAT